MSRLRKYYQDTVVKKLMQECGLKNVMQVPKITKITLNMGVGEAINDKKHLTSALSELSQIAGQKAVATLAKKSIAGFKIREKWPLGCKVTLREDKMWYFLDKLLAVSIPRIRDFRGFRPQAFDGQGNYSIGITEQLIFPEIEYDKIDSIRGLNITITTSATNDEHGRALLKAFKFPFKEK